jgi:hypothetical protein
LCARFGHLWIKFCWLIQFKNCGVCFEYILEYIRNVDHKMYWLQGFSNLDICWFGLSVPFNCCWWWWYNYRGIKCLEYSLTQLPIRQFNEMYFQSYIISSSDMFRLIQLEPSSGWTSKGNTVVNYEISYYSRYTISWDKIYKNR